MPTAVVAAAVYDKLLACGDEISPPVSATSNAGKRLLHEVCKPGPSAAPAAATKVVVGDESESGEESEAGQVSDPEETVALQERLEQRVRKMRNKHGPDHDLTLKQTFKLLDCLIGQYKLNHTDEILMGIAEVCKRRGSDWYVKWIQSLAFCRWKQHQYKEALQLFHEQERIVGASAALCENIGHTYSSIGNLQKAEEYFISSINLLKQGSFGNKGGVYMGLGLVKDRLGKTAEALPLFEQSLEHYQREHTHDHRTADSSIIAKAHTSIGKTHEKLNNLQQAAWHLAEALRIFRATVGESSPLTAGALGTYGKLRLKMGGEHRKEARALLVKALRLEVAKDAFHLETVWELFNQIKDLHMDEIRNRKPSGDAQQDSHLGALRAAYAPYIPLVEAARARLTPAHEERELGTLAVWYKTVGELCCLAQDYAKGQELLNEALRLLRNVDNFDCSSLIDGCRSLLEIARANAPKEEPRIVELSSRDHGRKG